MSAAFLPSEYSTGLVLLSVVVAVFASFVALDLARRVHDAPPHLARIWLAGGSIAMGTGIWSMHFLGMLAFRLPIALGYDIILTLLSWMIVVAVSGLALAIAGRPRLTMPWLLGGALAMGAGICAMHYLGMFAMRMSPPIVWHAGWVAASAAIATTASLAALLLFHGLRRANGLRRLNLQGLAAIVMGGAIAGMHYSGMAAANFPLDSVCGAALEIDTYWLAGTIGGAALLLLSTTLFASIVDARIQSRTAKLARSLKAANRELSRIAFRDPLTGLANRLVLEDRIDHAATRSERTGDRLALFFIDLDGFKPINDSFGHQAGDTVLRVIGGRIGACCRETDTVARIGGDEFAILVEDAGGRETLGKLAERIVQSISQPIELHEHPTSLSCSIGIAVFPENSPAERLVAHADAAMYHAKRDGKATYRFFTPEMDAGAAETIKLQQDLRAGLNRGEFELYYQLKRDARSGACCGAEALLRWRHPGRGMVEPDNFLPVAERFGLMVPLGNWVLDEAIRQAGQWLRDGMPVPVAINLSPLQLRQPDLQARLAAALARNKVPPEMITLEITESAAMEDADATLALVERLNQQGLRISIDDFGTGYSSLSYLRRFTADQIKIDRAFIADMVGNPDALALVAGVIQLAHSLDLRVVAEGVETEAQQARLIELGCDEMQGFLFSCPAPAAGMAARIGAADTFTAPPLPWHASNHTATP